MATDYSQHMDVFGKQELGWVVPRVPRARPDARRSATGRTSRSTPHRIDWKRPTGRRTRCSGAGVEQRRGLRRQAAGPRRSSTRRAVAVRARTNVWWSGSGNDFGCTPAGGHNLDIALPELERSRPGRGDAAFKSRWDIEWDFDYGFVLVSTDDGTDLPLARRRRTATRRRDARTRTRTAARRSTATASPARAAPTPPARRPSTGSLGNYADAPFVDDEYDLSRLIGKPGAVLRFAYSTDPGLARPGWFIDDLEINGRRHRHLRSTSSAPHDPALFNGGCRDGLGDGAGCTARLALRRRRRRLAGRSRLPTGDARPLRASTSTARASPTAATLDVPAGRAARLHRRGSRLRQRRAPTTRRPRRRWTRGPSPVDTPNLDDAAFKQAGDSYSRTPATGHTDNYTDATSTRRQLAPEFDCLGFNVRLAGGGGSGRPPRPGRPHRRRAPSPRLTAAAPFDYGIGTVATPLGAHRRDPGEALDRLRPASGSRSLDGSLSSDDLQAPNELTYNWTFGDGSAAAYHHRPRTPTRSPGRTPPPSRSPTPTV